MANFNWKTGTSGDWNLATNWTEGAIPNDAAADVTMKQVADPSYTVTIAAGASDTVQTIDLNSNLVVNGTLTFAPGSIGDLGHDYEGSVVTMTNGTIVNAGLVYAHVDTFGAVEFKGTNPVYLAFELQVHDGTTTLDTSSIGLLKSTTMFDGIFEVESATSTFNFGGKLGGLTVDIEEISGPKATLTPNFFSQLIYDGPGSQINEWNGTAYVPVESTLKLIDNAAFVTVTGGRDYTTAGTLTIGNNGMFEQAGGTLTTGGLTLLAGGVLAGGISVTGSVVGEGQVTVKGAVTNNGQIVSDGPGIVFRDAITGTGEITFNRTAPLPGWLHGEVVGAVPGIVEVGAVGAGQTIKMIGNDIVVLDNFAAFNGAITATGTGNTLALVGFTQAQATVAVGVGGGVALTIGGKTIQAGNIQQLRFSDGDVAVGPPAADPVVSSPTLLVAENAASGAIGIAAPTDPNYMAAQLVITAATLPTDGGVTLANGTAVAAGQVLTADQLTGLRFTPTTGKFDVTSTFTYTVADPAKNVSTGTATLTVGPALGSPVLSSPTLLVAENAAAGVIGIAAPTDPNYTAAQLVITAATLPTDGSVTLADGTAVSAGQVLTGDQLTSLRFTPAAGKFNATSAFTYTVADPAKNVSTGTATLAIGPALGSPVLSSPTLTVAENAAAGVIGIAAPTDPNYTAAQLVITAATLPADGSVTLADGTAVAAGQVLTGDQLTGLLFTPTAGQFNASSAFTYTVADPAENVSTGTATLAIGAEIPVVPPVGGGTGTPPPPDMLVMPAPVDGVSITDLSSADINAVLSLGTQLSFIGGTETVMLTDSSLSVGPDTNAATIQRLYVGLLGRATDTAGLVTWDAQLSVGVSKASVADSILKSQEYVAGHGTPDDSQFVASLYQGLLGRPPEAAGAALWTGQLALGVSRGTVAAAIADSAEAKSNLATATAQLYVPSAAGTLVHELYETGLGREVEASVLPTYKAMYASTTPTQFATAITQSAEFMSLHAGQDNNAYVASLYQAGFGRAVDPGGLATWTDLLNSGASRGVVLLDIATSGEAAARLTHNLAA